MLVGGNGSRRPSMLLVTCLVSRFRAEDIRRAVVQIAFGRTSIIKSITPGHLVSPCTRSILHTCMSSRVKFT